MSRTELKLIIGGIVILVLVVILIALAPFTIVAQSDRGIVFNWGRVDRVLEPGIHWVNPISEEVVTMDVTTQKEEVGAGAASKDLQVVNATIALNYQLDSAHLVAIWSEVKNEYKERLIAPAIQESVKVATAKYTAEELITKRELVKSEILAFLKTNLAQKHITVLDVFITNFDFSAQFNVAIESKVKAEQEALKAKNDLERVKFEAEQRVATAEADAKAIRLASDAANNPRYVELKKLEVALEYAKKWNGALPQNLYAGAPIPFIDVNNVK